LNEHGIKTNINELLKAMTELKIAETFFGSVDRPEKVRTFTKVDGLVQKVEEIYHLKLPLGKKWHGESLASFRENYTKEENINGSN